ncbi:MAG: ABC transporter permease subunit [Verrucomicrobiota bacterium]
MRKVFAIAGIAIRSAIRSRVVLMLLALLLIAIIALPMTIKGDGTLTGAVQVLLRYTLGAVNIILSIATLWAGCAAIANEVQEHQVHLLVTKPVTRAQLWLGKWLGLLALNAALLTVAGGVTYGLLHWHLSQQNLSPQDRATLREEWLVARRVVNAEPVAVEADAQRIFEEQRRRGMLPKETRPDQALAAIRQTLLQQAHAVPPNLMMRHIFKVPATTPRSLVVRYKFTSSQNNKNPVACIWLAGAPTRPDRFQRPELAAPNGMHTFQIPAALVAADSTLTVDIANVNPEPLAMVFAPADGVQLLVYESSFLANFSRCLLVLLGELAFLGALAVTMGSLFSLPVAALTTAYAVILMNIGSYLQTLTQETFIIGSTMNPGTTPGLLDLLMHFVYVGLFWMTKPFQTASPLEPLAVGELVSWWWVGGVWWCQVLVAGGILAAVGTWIFNRRELGLPS